MRRARSFDMTCNADKRAHSGICIYADAGPVNRQILDIEVGVQLLMPIEHYDNP